MAASQKPQNMTKSYGAARYDVLGAITSILLIWVLLVWLVIEAIKRIITPSEIDALFMLYTSIFGLAANLSSLLIL